MIDESLTLLASGALGFALTPACYAWVALGNGAAGLLAVAVSGALGWLVCRARVAASGHSA